MKNLSLNRRPSLIICVSDSKLQDTIINLTDSTHFSSVYLSTYSELIADIETKNSMSVVIEFANENEDNLYFINQIKKNYPHIDIVVIYSFQDSETNTKEFRLKALQNGATDCIKYPDEINFLDIRLNNSYSRQFSMLELNTNLEFWNTINKAVKSIIKDLYGKAFYKRLLKQSINITKSDFGALVMIEGEKPAYSIAWDGSNWVEEDQPGFEFSRNLFDLQLNDNCIFMEDDEILNQSNLPFVFRQSTLRSYLNFPFYNKNREMIGFMELYKTSSRFDPGLHTTLIKIILETLPFDRITWKEPAQKDQPVEIRYDDNYLAIVDNTPLPIIIIKNDLISFVNKTTANILGYEKRDLINTEFAKISPSPLKSRKLNDDYSDPNAIGMITLDFQKKNGETVTLHGDMSFISFMNSNAILLIFGELRSSSDKAAAPSGSSEALRLAAAVNSLKSAVTITDMERNIVYVNPAHKNTFGYEQGELIGNPSGMLFSINDPSGISEKIYDAIVAVGWEGERISKRKDGEVFPSYEKISLVKDKDGSSIGIVSIIDEITERKRLEQALKESEERYRTLVETASTAIIALDQDGRIMLYNPSAENIFLYTKTELIDKTMMSLIKEISGDISEIDELIGTTTELSGVNKEGNSFPIEITFSKCIIEGKTIYTAIILDITERKNLQNQLIQSAKLAAIGELISGVTHEVNNPLAVVMGYAEMLLGESNIDEETKKAVKVIFSESERARKVIQNMLSFARQNAPEKEPVMLNEVIEKTLELADFDLRKNNVTVVKNFDSSLPLILGESNQLQQVFLNLLMNAQQAISENGSEGTITIETSRDPSTGTENGSGFVNVVLSDDGPGIPKKIVDEIFDPFFTTKPEGVGTGLGLSVSLGIIKDHNGNIKVESEENKGTSFYIQFPFSLNS